MKVSGRSGPLAVRSFRLLADGQFASTIGDYCYAVALPWLVLSAHGGVILLGTVLACYGVPRTVLIPVGGVLADKLGPRTLMLAADAVRCVVVAMLAVLAAWAGGLRAPAIFASVVFLAEFVAIALVPYLGGEAGAAAMLCLSGVCNGLGNVIFLTVMQKWVAPGQLGRVMGVLMLCAFSSFPPSVAVLGVLVRHLGPVPFFPLAGALVAVADVVRSDAAGVPRVRGPW